MHEELYVCFEMTRCSELHTRGAPPLTSASGQREGWETDCAMNGAVGLGLVGRDDGLRVTQLSRQLAWLLLRRQSGR